MKFGRVRYKVIMFHNERLGLKSYDLMDRFRLSENGRKTSVGKKKRRVGVPMMASNRTHASGGPETSDRGYSGRLPRF